MTNILNLKRMRRVRRKLKLVSKNRFRLSVYRSAKNMSAQIIDDKNHTTVVSVSSREKETANKVKKKDLPNHVAEILAKRALDKKISKVYFDRGRYRYHGQVKVFAETLRKNGILF